MNAFKQWYVTNQDAITWFLIGWLTLQGLHDIAKGDYFWAGISFVFAVSNYALSRVRLT
jgi:hypothetical protein